jgi:cobalt/nickel transport system permease protein
VTALGANLFNMAIVAPGVGYAIYAIVRRLAGGSLRARLLGTAFAAWCSTVAASIACAGQLALSGTVAWSVALPAMAGIHALIGIGEALISTLVVAGVAQLRPELLAGAEATSPRARHGASVVYGLLISLGLAIFVAPFACPWPDGLEKVAARLGFEHRAAALPVLAAPLPDYTLPGIKSVVLSTILAGCVGTGIAFGLAYLLARALTPRTAAGRNRAAEIAPTDASRPA